jgi:hypothetical protein
MSGSASVPQGVTPQVGDTPRLWAPAYHGAHPLLAAPALESAADDTGGSRFLVPLAGAALAATALLVVRTARRSWARRG